MPIEETLLVQSHLAKNAQAIDGLLGRNGFVLGQKLSLSKVLYATEDPSVVYLEFSMDFEEALEQLPDGARQVFVLHDVEGYRHDEIAELLGIVPGTSKSQLHHARMALRKQLER